MGIFLEEVSYYPNLVTDNHVSFKTLLEQKLAAEKSNKVYTCDTCLKTFKSDYLKKVHILKTADWLDTLQLLWLTSVKFLKYLNVLRYVIMF